MLDKREKEIDAMVIAKRTGQTTDWDSKNMNITSSKKANKLLCPYIREGWECSA